MRRGPDRREYDGGLYIPRNADDDDENLSDDDDHNNSVNMNYGVGNSTFRINERSLQQHPSTAIVPRDDNDDPEQRNFEKRLCEDGVGVRKINHNGKSQLRRVQCVVCDDDDGVANTANDAASRGAAMVAHRVDHNDDLRRDGRSPVLLNPPPPLNDNSPFISRSRSDVSSITAGFDQEVVEELHHALNELRAELEASRAEAARAVKVAEQAIQSAEDCSSWSALSSW